MGELIFDVLLILTILNMEVRLENNVMTRKTIEQVFVEMTEKEKNELADEIAKAWKKKARLEDEKKTFNSEIGAKIKTIQGEIDTIADALTSGKLEKKELITVEYDFEEEEVRKVLKSGEVIHVRPMTDDDRQMSLDDFEEPEEDEELEGAE